MIFFQNRDARGRPAGIDSQIFKSGNAREAGPGPAALRHFQLK
jgi:hypothetical protein